jgi:hypothetical protein
MSGEDQPSDEEEGKTAIGAVGGTVVMLIGIANYPRASGNAIWMPRRSIVRSTTMLSNNEKH